MRKVASIRTKKFVRHALTTLAILAVFLLIYRSYTDEIVENHDITGIDNFKELINTENSLILFYSDG